MARDSLTTSARLGQNKSDFFYRLKMTLAERSIEGLACSFKLACSFDWLVISCSSGLTLLDADCRPTLSRSGEKILAVGEHHMVSDSLFRVRLFLNLLHRS